MEMPFSPLMWDLIFGKVSSQDSLLDTIDKMCLESQHILT
jgi:hypothetical protein